MIRKAQVVAMRLHSGGHKVKSADSLGSLEKIRNQIYSPRFPEMNTVLLTLQEDSQRLSVYF